MQPSLTVSQSKHYNIPVLQRKQTFLARNVSLGASSNLKVILISLIRSLKHFMTVVAFQSKTLLQKSYQTAS